VLLLSHAFSQRDEVGHVAVAVKVKDDVKVNVNVNDS
jgi:hypothetical protein